MTLYTPGAVFDERRNTSRVFQPDPLALDAAMRETARLRRTHPELVQWILDGHPTLTEAEHRARFGEDYTRKPQLVPPGDERPPAAVAVETLWS